MNIQTKIEGARGCGYRKLGGLYMIGGRLGTPCGKLPIELSICPCCGAGIKFSRGFTWVGNQLIKDAPCSTNPCKQCPTWDGSIERYGLMWIGEKFYKTPADFVKETWHMGISKRIASIPREFEIGKHWILLAHRKAVHAVSEKGEPEMRPGIFQAFLPTHFEYVVRGDETEEELEAMVKRGITPVRVVRDQPEMS